MVTKRAPMRMRRSSEILYIQYVTSTQNRTHIFESVQDITWSTSSQKNEIFHWRNSRPAIMRHERPSRWGVSRDRHYSQQHVIALTRRSFIIEPEIERNVNSCRHNVTRQLSHMVLLQRRLCAVLQQRSLSVLVVAVATFSVDVPHYNILHKIAISLYPVFLSTKYAFVYCVVSGEEVDREHRPTSKRQLV